MNIPDQTVTRDVWWHLMITLSFYMSELMGLFFDVKRKDFWSMFIHHVVSIVLFFFAWKSNLYRMFMVALVLLDCSEILLEVLFSTEVIKILPSVVLQLSKIMVYLGHDRISFVTFFTFLFVWVVTRLGYYPFWLLKR
jgi:hypothetical protein